MESLNRTRLEPDNFVLLSEAFHRVCRSLFPKERNGFEPVAVDIRIEHDREFEHERERLNKKFVLAHLHELSQRAVVRETLSATELFQHDRTFEEARRRTLRTREARDRFINPLDCRVNDAAAFERREAVEALICDAVDKRQLHMLGVHGFPARAWERVWREPEFQICFATSTVHLPKSQGGQKLVVGFTRAGFDLWAAEREYEALKFSDAPLKERVVEWFRVYKLLMQVEGTELEQSLAKTDCANFFEGHDVGAYFEAAWVLFA